MTRAADPAMEPAPGPAIDDHGLVGDGRSAALIARDGTVTWLCWPRFESPPVFAGLLDPARGGTWRLAPLGARAATRGYVDDTNVLETRYVTTTGTCVVTDAMTIGSEQDKARRVFPDHELVRRVACERGEVVVEVDVDARPDFGRAAVRVRDLARLGVRWETAAGLLVLRADVPVVLGSDGVARATVRLRAGEAACFSLTFDEEGPAVMPALGDAARASIERSIAWWRAWSARARYAGPDRTAVVRGALALKLMSFAPSGAIVAAPTTSLPEQPGGAHNWDYRYCWLRDASFTARVLLDLGYLDEAAAFGSWLLHTTRLTRPELRILYDVYGNPPVAEHVVPGVAGYRGARPVRVGNAAFGQVQLDAYGAVIDAIAQYALVTGALDRETRALLRDFGEHVCAHWHEPDAGIWEPRGRPRHHTHSRLLCWVALDRLLALDDHGFIGQIDRAALAAHRAAIRADIEQHAYDLALGCYRGALDGGGLDASVLLMSWHGFHPARSHRMRSTYARLAARLGAGPGLFYRYQASRRRGEGAFWLCSFWAVEHLLLGGGTVAEARALFADACAYANDLGLMAEEVDPRTGCALGNFPQAYTHVGVISAALSLAEREGAG
jgi:GH15 family glucan-1,4-alpha-glucosidase